MRACTIKQPAWSDSFSITQQCEACHARDSPRHD
ncbi:MAG: CxxxxCH/CxxCH domain-containing protein [Sulfuritalea sp.]|nr:CxxxxCH/CxxCH domain-containing protein [Polynucleobacter sp.]MCF8189064.1 CxxxxCH/CxxCH domain-containing protein [Sulfuritalea sp.]